MSLKSLSVTIGADTSEFSQGIRAVTDGIKATQETAEKVSKSLASQAASLASEYKKQGVNASEAFKKAWSEIERTSSQSSKSKNFGLKNIFSGFSSSAKSAKNSADELKKSLSETDNAFSAVSDGIKTLVSSAFALVGVTAIVKGLVQAFQAYTSLESSVNRVTDIFEDSARYIQYFAQNTAKSLGMAESSVYEYAATYGNLFKNITYDTYENAKVTIAMLQASAVVASKTGRTMEDVMERIRSGLLGNTEAIEDLGINVNVAMLEVTDAFSKIADGRSWEQLTFYEQQQIRTLAILEQASGNFGDEIQQGSAFSVSVLTGAFEDLSSTAGELVNEVFQPIIKYLTTTVQSITTALQSLNTDGLQPVVNMLHNIVQYAVTALKSLVNLIGIDITFSETDTGIPESFSVSAESSGEISDNMENTEKTAKKLKKTLAGFDELNVLSVPDTDKTSLTDVSSDTGTTKSVFSSLPDLEISDEPALTVDIDTSGLERNLAKVKNNLKPLTDSLSGLWDALKPFAQNVGEGLLWFCKNVLKPLAKWTITKALPKFLDILSGTIELLTGILKNFKPLGKWLWESFLKPIAKWTGDTVIQSLEIIAKLIKKLGDYTPAIDGIVAGLAAFAGVKLFDQLGIIAKLSGAFTALKNAILPVITAFEVAGGGFEGLMTVITTGISTAIASFTAFMQGLSPIMKIGVTIAGVTASFSTALSSMYDLKTGAISLGDALKNIAVVVVPVGVALTAMLGPIGLAMTAVAALMGAIIGVNNAIDDNIYAVSKSTIYDEMGTPISEYGNAVSELAETITNETADIISLGDTINSNDEKIKDNSDELQGLIDRVITTGDMSEEMAEKISTSASEIATASQENITQSTNGIIKELGKHFEDTASISGKSTNEIISNLYLLEAEGNQLIANTYKEIDELSASMVNMDRSSEEFSNAQNRLSELSKQLFDYSGYADTTVESADSLIRKLQELDSNKINWEDETAVNEAMNAITEGYASSMADLDSASESAIKVIDNQYKAYKSMGLLDEEGEKIFSDLKNGIASGYENQKNEITGLISQKMTEIKDNAVISYGNAFSAAENEIYNGSFGGFFKHFSTQLSATWNGKDFEDEMSKNIENSMDNSVRDGVNNAVSKLKNTANLYGQSEDLFEEIPEGASKGIDNGLPKIEESTKRMNEQTVTTTKKTSEINSPSKVFERLGIFIPQGFANGIKNGIQQVSGTVKTMCTQVISTAKSGLKNFPDIFDSAFSNSLGHLKTFCINLKSEAEKGLKELPDIFNSVFSNSLEYLKIFCINLKDETEKGLKYLPDIFKSIFLSSSAHFTDFIKCMKDTAKDGTSATVSIIKNALSALPSEISNMQNPFENYFGNILDKANSFKSGFLNTMWSVRDSLGDIFYNISVDCWNFGESLNSNLKNALNQMIGSFNTAFQGLNSISYALSAIPGYNLSFDIPEIPYLAKGGVVSSPTLAMIGESGKEAVIPLENSSWIDELAKKISTYSGSSTDKEINIQLNVSAFPGEKAFQRYCIKAYRNEISRGGKIS